MLNILQFAKNWRIQRKKIHTVLCVAQKLRDIKYVLKYSVRIYAKTFVSFLLCKTCRVGFHLKNHMYEKVFLVN